MRKGIKTIIKIIGALFACWLLYAVLVMFFVFPVKSDVAKRIQSPDRAKTALLIRRSAFIDLNFVVKIKNGFIPETLHSSKDYSPDPSIDWNEKLIWSDDSSFLVMIVDDIGYSEGKYMWAYDFNDNKEYSDNAKIIEILNSRSKDVTQG